MFALLRSPREIHFGRGTRDSLPWIAAREGRRALLIADQHLADSGALGAIIQGLEAAGLHVAVWTDVLPELPSDLASRAADFARDLDRDLVITVGGGSCIDLGKVVATLLRHGGRASDYYGEFRVPGPSVPLIAVPTTAGTGSEATPVAVVTDSELGTKVGISSPHLIPIVAICDPELTYSCPQPVTASAGADALAHCIESLTARVHPATPELARDRVFVGRSELTDLLATTGIASIVSGLPQAFAHPDGAAGREQAMYGSLLAGMAFGTAGTAAAHALQYPIGAETSTPHGVGVGCLLPYVMAFNRAERVAEMAIIARHFGAEGEDHELSFEAPRLVADFLAQLGIPRTLGEMGVRHERAGWIAENGLRAVRLTENNPRTITEDGARQIIDAAIDGDLQSLLDEARTTEDA
jgi:alcohol dehydrogenase